jgi:hypothetical protein
MNQSLRSKFTVIEGGQLAVPNLLRLPNAVMAPSPFDRRSLVAFRIGTEDYRKALGQNRRTPVLDLWSLVIGQLPPVPNASKFSDLIEQLDAHALQNAHACFKGVRRPVADDKLGLDQFVFITKPRVHFRYVPSMVCVMEEDEIPSDVVLATYVTMDFPVGRPGPSRRQNVPFEGIITRSHFIEADPNDAQLPIQYEERYQRRLW